MKIHFVVDASGHPSNCFMWASQVSDDTGAAALLDDLPKAQWLLGQIVAMMPAGSAMRFTQKASNPAFPVTDTAAMP